MTTMPTVVVMGHNRPESLDRCLRSIQASDPMRQSIDLVISIDIGGDQTDRVIEVAHSFTWDRGQQSVIVHPQRMGLFNHYLWCGDLTQTRGSILILEDDCIAGKTVFRHTAAALEQYASDSRIAGFSLGTPTFNGYTQLPFMPIDDGSDGYFMQVAWYHGQCFTAEQWAAFRTWMAEHQHITTGFDLLHPMFRTFPDSEWFPLMMRYLATTGRTFHFPRTATVTNLGLPGTHFKRPSRLVQAPLQYGWKTPRFLPLDQAVSVYDSYQEIFPQRLRAISELDVGSLTIDLNHARPTDQINTEWVLTRKPARIVERSYGDTLWPIEANIIESIQGEGLHLCRTESLKRDRWSDFQAKLARYRYGVRGQQPSLFHFLALKTNRI